MKYKVVNKLKNFYDCIGDLNNVQIEKIIVAINFDKKSLLLVANFHGESECM